MSETEANLPGLELTDNETPKKAAKKAARKTATKKAARKRVAKKTAAAADSDAQPAPATAAADDNRQKEDAPATARKAPARKAETATEDDSAPSARPTRRYTPRRASNDEDDIPQAFSAAPDDIDDYGDVRERNRRQRAAASDAADTSHTAAADDRQQRHPDDRADGEAGTSQPRDEGRARPYNRDSRDNRDTRDNRGDRDNRDHRDNREDRDSRDYRDNRDNREGGREGGREFNRPQHGGGHNPQGKGNGNGQPYGKKGHFQKGNGNYGNGGPGGGNSGQGNVGQAPQGQGGGKFQKPFKKGDKFAANHPGGAHQPGKKGGKQPYPLKAKGGKRSSWQSQFAAASEEDMQPPVFENLIDWELFRSPEQLEAKIAEITSHTAPATIAATTEALQGADAEATPLSDAETAADAEAAAQAAETAQAAEVETAQAADEAADTEPTTAATDAGSDGSSSNDADSSSSDGSNSNNAGSDSSDGSDSAAAIDGPFDYTAAYALKLPELEALARGNGIRWEGAPQRRKLLEKLQEKAVEQKRPIRVTGLVELLEEGFGFIVFGEDNYRLRSDSPFLAAPFVTRHGLQRGHEVEALLHPARPGETTPFVLRVDTVMGKPPEEIQLLTPFKELTPYYPTERILLESEQGALGKWDNISMRIVDLLSPVGLGQRGLIVAPPRTGKTVLMQGIANAIRVNRPQARLIILLVDERPEEVTDFRRSVKGAQVVASTFDEAAESHVHAAEMVIEKARRLVETGEDVIILLDSITRLARAYNTTMPSSGKILSGGVEASALQKPKRFFGSARNIEDGGSLTILGTALVDTGSKMDEVIFEEFKGTGNMELHLDRDLSNKRVFPALSFEKSGTRKEELLYHPDEMEKVHALRRAMKGVPSTEAMEMLIQRIKRSKTNAQFLMSMAR